MLHYKCQHCLLLCFTLFVAFVNSCIVPDLSIDALTKGGFRVQFKTDNLAIQRIKFRANLNHDLSQNDVGTFSAHIYMTNQIYGFATFPNVQVTNGDKIYFLVDLHCTGMVNVVPGIFIIRETLNAYPERLHNCTESITAVNGGYKCCAGDVILFDDFKDSVLNINSWFVEQWIPTYTPPKFLFNLFENKNSTIFTKDGKLYIKPIPMTKEDYNHGSLDLRYGCTAKMLDECHTTSRRVVELPAVKSGKILSQTSFRYGKIEIKAKLPAGEWIYPIIYLEQKNKENGENSPTVWIAYSRGNEHLLGNANDDLGASLLFSGPVLFQLEPLRSQKLVTKRHPKPLFAEFHTYTLDWKPGLMSFGIDGEHYGAVDLGTFVGEMDVRSDWNAPDAPFDKEYVISLGVAVGGNVEFPDDYISYGYRKPWYNTDPSSVEKFWENRDTWLKSWNGDDPALQVEYVKITAI